MEQFEQLFKAVSKIVQQAKIANEESRLRGEQFNIFKVCGIDHYELQHSAIIAELLNPNSSHGQGCLYLKLFMEAYGSKLNISNLKSENITVRKEEPSYDDEKYNGRMDIFVDNKRIPFVIIENKIFAYDQPIQLKKYDSEAKRRNAKEGEYEIVYLTIDGKEATEDSGEGVKYIRMSYSKNIIQWLDMCIEHSSRIPLVRETLIQYQNHIKQLTHQDMRKIDSDKLLQIMSQYPEAIREICSRQYDYWWYMYETFVKNQLDEVAKELGMVFDSSQMTKSGQCCLCFYKPEWNNNKDNNRVYIEFGSDRKEKDKDFYVGITSSTGKINLAATNYSEGGLNIFKEFGPTESWPLGWKMLESPFCDWSYNSDIIIKMKNGDFVDYIKKTLIIILNELDKNCIDLSKAV